MAFTFSLETSVLFCLHDTQAKLSLLFIVVAPHGDRVMH